MLLSSRNVHCPDGNIQPSEEMSRIWRWLVSWFCCRDEWFWLCKWIPVFYGFSTTRNTKHRVKFYSFLVNMKACKLCNIARRMEQILGLASPMYACPTTVGQNILQVSKAQYHKKTTDWAHRHTDQRNKKVRFCTIFSDAWKKNCCSWTCC